MGAAFTERLLMVAAPGGALAPAGHVGGGVNEEEVHVLEELGIFWRKSSHDPPRGERAQAEYEIRS